MLHKLVFRGLKKQTNLNFPVVTNLSSEKILPNIYLKTKWVLKMYFIIKLLDSL